MAKLTWAQVKKYNEEMGNGWQFSVQNWSYWGEKTAEQRTEQDENGVLYEATLRFQDERIGEGWTVKSTGRQLVFLTVTKMTETETSRKDPGSTCKMYHTEKIGEKQIGEPQSRRMFSYIQKLTKTLDFSEILDEFLPKEKEPREVAEIADIDENGKIYEGMQFVDSLGEILTITELNSMSVEFNNGERSIYDFGTNRTIKAIKNALGVGTCFLTNKANQTETSGQEQTTTEAAQSETTTIAEEMTTEEEKTTENGTNEATQAQEQPTEETADTITAEPCGDMFAELAKAFITGKQAPKQPHKATKAEQTEETPTAEETQPKSDYNPPEPQPEKSGTGYTGEPSEVFTTAQFADILNGKSVILGEDYDRRAYIAPTPYNSARLVYSYRLGRQSAEILPGMSPEYCGFIANGAYYSTAKNADIAAELAEDINAYIKNRIQTEEQAEQHATEVCEPYELEKVKNAHQYAQTESARRHFFEDTAPTLNLYTQSRETKATDIVSYLTHPMETVERIASEYIQYNAEDIATAYIIYNKTVEALNEITSDPTHTAHAVKRITKAMSAEYKTVKVTIANGETVTAEARGINALRHSGYMSSYYVASSDRQKLPKDGHRAKDIQPEEIKQITHGGRILYKAS